MKGLTLYQPWASLIAIGAKQYETRSWATSYRGLLAIHAAKAFPRKHRDLCDYGGQLFEALQPHFRFQMIEKGTGKVLGTGAPFSISGFLPQGAIVAVVDLVECTQMDEKALRFVQPQERAFGDWRVGRWAWGCNTIQPLKEPIPCKGAQGLWNVPADVEAEIRRQLPGIKSDRPSGEF